MQTSSPRYLSIDPETARKQITDHIDTVRTTRSDDRIVVKSTTGFTLAYLSEHTLPSGEQGTRFVYRTGPSVPVVLSSLRVTAKRIRDLLTKYEVSGR